MKNFFRFFVLAIMLFASADITAQVKKKTVQQATAKKTAKAVVKKKPVPTKPVVQEQFTKVKITTDFGEMVIRLYNKTPQHRDNFIKLVQARFYDSLLFHRVINSFMIQGGDPASKTAAPGQMLGGGDVGYTIPAEFDSALIHKKGALCAARTENPEMASSGCQFYIVQGRLSSDAELDNIQRANGMQYTPAQRMTYKMKGGTPFLDKKYTVFGEVESGIEVVDKIAAMPADGSSRPLSDIRMKIEIVGPITPKENL